MHEYLTLASYLCTVYSVDHKINCLVTDTCAAHVSVTAIFKPAFFPGVNLHLTESCVVKIDELFTGHDICPAQVSTLTRDNTESVAKRSIEPKEVSSNNSLEVLERKTRSGRAIRPPRLLTFNGCELSITNMHVFLAMIKLSTKYMIMASRNFLLYSS